MNLMLHGIGPSVKERMCFSKVVPAKRYGGSYCTSATFIRCCGCPQESFIVPVSRQTSSSSTESPRARRHGPSNYGSTISARTSTSRSRRVRYRAPISTSYRPENRHAREVTWSETNPEGRWRSYSYEELVARDKCNLDIFWLKDESLEDSENLPDPDVIAAEIVEDLRAALDQFAEIQVDLATDAARE